MHHEGSIPIDHPVLDLALQVAAGDMDGARHRTLFVLVRLTDVEHRGPRGDGRLGLGGVDLTDAGLGGAEQIAEAGHARKSTSWVRIQIDPFRWSERYDKRTVPTIRRRTG